MLFEKEMVLTWWTCFSPNTQSVTELTSLRKGVFMCLGKFQK